MGDTQRVAKAKDSGEKDARNSPMTDRQLKPLVHDIGMFNGDDSAYYLSCGYRVIAVEANPIVAMAARRRFDKELREQEIVILNCAISDICGPQRFWISEDRPEWSSFGRKVAGRDGVANHSITVKAVRYRDILAEYGVPDYLKIDIECKDIECVNDLDPGNLPANISVESECGGSEVALGYNEYIATLHRLYEKGYRRFKLVNQHHLIPVFPGNCNITTFHPSNVARWRAQLESKCSWCFPQGSSGPWGDKIDSPWMDREVAEDVYCEARSIYFERIRGPMYGFWFDWHAAL